MSIVLLSGVPKDLADTLSKRFEVVNIVRKIFPDGEQYLRIVSDVKDRSVTVIQSLYPDQDRKLVELYLALEALKGAGVKDLTVVLLYVAYARQDKRFLPGEPISIKALLDPMRFYGVKKLVVIDIHAPHILEELGLTYVNIVPHSYLVKKSGIELDYVLAPDKGALHRAEIISKELGVPYANLEKFRDRITGEIRIEEKELPVKGMRVAIVDDIVSTGGTLAKAVEALYRYEASKVYAVVSHALMVGSAIEKLERSGLEMLVTCNTIEHREELRSLRWFKRIDISELLISELVKE